MLRPSLLAAALLLIALPAEAYVGPGAALSLLGALWGLVVAVVVALGVVLLWPLRKMLKKRRRATVAAEASERSGS